MVYQSILLSGHLDFLNELKQFVNTGDYATTTVGSGTPVN